MDNNNMYLIFKSLSSAALLNLGLRYKYFTTPHHTLFGHYFILGLSYTHLSWSYENSIVVDGDLINNDSLDGIELFGGMGVNLLQTDNLQLGLEAIPSMTLWLAKTSEGFDNDVFDNFYTIKIRLTLRYLWNRKD